MKGEGGEKFGDNTTGDVTQVCPAFISSTDENYKIRAPEATSVSKDEEYILQEKIPLRLPSYSVLPRNLTASPLRTASYACGLENGDKTGADLLGTICWLNQQHYTEKHRQKVQLRLF